MKLCSANNRSFTIFFFQKLGTLGLSISRNQAFLFSFLPIIIAICFMANDHFLL